ncbi:MAG: AAA family ATPase, partial [Deltaproteobacteria bacterium]|nr:AAA family ATPase [Deltaproteobacteria bacterium]
MKKLPEETRNIICIANQKGGVGKTTTAINLSASLAAAERKTLLIDCDPQGNATSGVGIDPSTINRKNLYYALIEDAPFEEVVFKTQIPTLDIVPSNQDLIGVEIE